MDNLFDDYDDEDGGSPEQRCPRCASTVQYTCPPDSALNQGRKTGTLLYNLICSDCGFEFSTECDYDEIQL